MVLQRARQPELCETLVGLAPQPELQEQVEALRRPEPCASGAEKEYREREGEGGGQLGADREELARAEPRGSARSREPRCQSYKRI